MDEKIYNKKSHRYVTVNGTQYKKLINEGYRVNEDDQLSPPKIITNKNIIELPSKYVKIHEIFNNEILLSNLDPKDLLSLYLTSKDVADNLNNIVKPKISYKSK